MKSNYQGPGIYRHYKGGEYQVIGLAIREETKESGWITEVIYKPLSPGSLIENHEAAFWARRLDDFNAMVDVTEPRFEFLYAK